MMLKILTSLQNMSGHYAKLLTLRRRRFAIKVSQGTYIKCGLEFL